MARKQGISGFRPKLVSIAVASCFAAGSALANPTGPQVVNGQVSVLQNGNVLQITNSPNSIINWQTFSIGANEITRFIQQSQASAVLNRVTAGNPSQILGTLQSNGRVFLINPSGIVFGAGAQVDVAGLVASSLNLSNQDFLAGKLKFADAPGAGSVLNQGNITTGSGGQVYLVGPAVENKGIITSPNGEVVLAAGNSVELVSPGTPNLRVEITASDNEARNLGQIVVDSGRAGIYAGLITNSGTVRADSVVAEGGKILLKATKSATLTDSSVLSAKGKGGGEIKVLATDNVRVAGTLDASAPTGGDGGFIETSAHHVSVADGVRVSTMAPFGKIGTYLIDPTDFTIAASGGDMTGLAVTNLLNTSNFSITSDMGTAGGTGDINVNDGVGVGTAWTAATMFNLLARNNVNVNAPIINSGAGGVGIYAGWDGGPPTSPIAVIPGVGDININKNVMTGGLVILTAGHDINLVSPTNGINVKASDTLTVNAGGTLSITGSPGFSAILQSDGDQFITAGSLYMAGASSGSNGSAQIRLGTNCTPGGCTPVPSSQTINIGGAAPGMFELEGGGGASNFAQIQSNGASQTINFAPGSDAELVGGTGTNGNFARIQAVTGTQTITGSPLLLLQGGTGGALDDGNLAQILALAGSQTIDAGTTQLIAGASGNSNFASISAPSQTITINGDLTLTGGGSASGSVQGGGARIGGPGGATSGPTSLNLTVVGGSVTLNGGQVANAGASIGSTQSGGQTTDITMTVSGDVMLNSTGVANGSARIGSPSSSVAGGDISISANSINLNSSGGVGTFIRTTGNVSLSGDFGISEGANSAIVAGGLEANSVNGSVSLTGPNMVGTLAGSARDSFRFVNGQGLTIGTVGSTSGITVDGSQAEIEVEVSSGNLTVSKNVVATGGGSSGTASISLTASGTLGVASGAQVVATGGNGDEGGGSAMVTLTAGSTIDVNGGTVQALGGYGTCCSGGGGTATITLSAPSGITVQNGSLVNAVGGNGFASFSSFGSGRGGNALISLTSASGPISVQSSTIAAIGGSGGPGGFSGGRPGGSAAVNFSAGGSIAMQSNSSVAAFGGIGGFSGSGGAASVSLSASGALHVSDSGIAATGGAGGANGSGFGMHGGNANISVDAASIDVAGFTVLSGFRAIGGDGGNAFNGRSGGNGGVAWVSVSATTGDVAFTKTGGPGTGIIVNGGNGGMGGGGDTSVGGQGGGGGWASGYVNASGNVLLTGGTITVAAGNGGNGGGGSFFGGQGGNGGWAYSEVTAGNNISLNGGSITVTGGNGGTGGSGGVFGGQGGRGSSASVYLSATNNITLLNASSITVNGGNGGSGGGGSQAGAKGGGSSAYADISAGGSISITNSTVTVKGGDGGRYGGSAELYVMTSTGDVSLSGTTISVNGGNASAGGSSNTGGGRAYFSIDSARDITLTASPVTVVGGDGAEGGSAIINFFAGRDILTGAGSNLTVLGGNALTTNNSFLIQGGSANASFNAGGAVTLNGNIIVTGGNGGAGQNSGDVFASGGDATVSVSGTTGIAVNGNITATGGNGGNANAFSEGCCAFAEANGGNGLVSLSSGGNITTGGGTLTATGGNGGFAAGSGGNSAAGGFALVQISTNSASSIIVGGPVTANGGAGGGTSFGSNGAGQPGGGAQVIVSAGSITVNGPISANGGFGGSGSAFSLGAAQGGQGGFASVSLNAFNGSLTINNPVSATGGSGGFASANASAIGGAGGSGSINLMAANGITVSGAVSAVGGAGGGASGSSTFGGNGGGASVLLRTPGAINISGSGVTAQGGGGASFIGNGGGASITADGGEGFPAGAGSVMISGPMEATGGVGNFGGSASVSIASATTIGLMSPGTIEAYGGPNSNGTVSLSATGGINLSGGTVEAQVGCSFTCVGHANVLISSGGNIDLGTTNISALGETTGFISIAAPSGYIHNGGGLLTATDTASGGANSSIGLSARDGIGTTVNPIRFGGANVDLEAVNSGSTGDIAVALTSGDITIDDLGNFVNANPNGIYFIRADSGNINLNTPFMPYVQSNACEGPCFSPTPLQPGQSVELHSPLGSIAIAPGAGIDGAAKVVLEAKTNLQLGSGSTVSSSSDVLLKSNAMDLQGTVTAANNIYVTPFDNGTAIDLGNPGAPGGVLALDGGELGRLTALGVGIGSDGVTTSGSAITISGPVGPFSAFPNLFGTTITESGSGSINSPGGINVVASGNVSLTGPNDIGAFSALSTGGGITLVNVGNLGLGSVNATGTVNLSSGGIIFNLGSPGAGTITAPSVVLAAADGIGQSSLPIFVPNATSVSATNTASGDIVLSQVGGNFTIGAGGWQLSNTGGDYIIGGNTVTLNGGPSTGNMFVTAGSDVNVGPSGYSNGGTVVLQALNNVNVSGNLTANDMALFADNQVNINGATVTGNNTVSVSATQLNITAGSAPAQLKAGSILGVVAGEINLTGGSGTNAFAEMSVGPAGEMDVFTLVSPATTGNINLKGGPGSGAYARIFGDPDVGSLLLPLSVDGVITMTPGAGSGAYARIESASVNSIHVDFVNVPSGGFFVNGVEGTVSNGQSGFFAGGQAAVPGQNLFVSYGGTAGSFAPSEVPQGVLTAINQVIATTQPLPTDGSSNGTSGGDTADETKVAGAPDEKQKKQLPICGK